MTPIDSLVRPTRRRRANRVAPPAAGRIDDAAMNRSDDRASPPAAPAAAIGWQGPGAVRAVHREEFGCVLACEGARVRISVERAGMIRVRIAPTGEFPRDASWAVIESDEFEPTFELRESADRITLTTPQIEVRIQRHPLRISFYSREGQWIAGDEPQRGLCWSGREISSYWTMRGDEHFFGLGEKGQPLSKRGQAVVNWNHDANAHEPWSDPLYQTHPFLIVSRPGGACHGIFFDNTWRSWFDLGLTSRSHFAFGADGGELNYYFIPGPTMAEVVRRYAKLVGTTPLPPRWSLGYQQCRWSYENTKRVRNLAALFRRRRIPCDTIYLDIDYMDGYRCFTWHKQRFGNPQQMMKQLAKDGFKIVVILDPGIKVDPNYEVYRSGLSGKHYATLPDGKPYVGKVWPNDSTYPDFLRAATRVWWGEQYRGLIADGVAGFWNDMNEPSDFVHADKTIPLDVRFNGDHGPCDHRSAHNIYGMQMARGTFDGVERLRPDERPFVLTRAGYSGVQRYAAVWTGDNASSWKHLRMSVPMQLNMGLSGLAFIGADVGGFRGAPTPELFTRWLQLGIFSPLFRTHTGGGPEQDPCAYGAKWEKLNRRAIETRYRLLPYLYTEMRHHAETGEPVMRPLVLDFPNHPGVETQQYEFMFGRQIFAAPVVSESERVRRTALPVGDWYEFHPAADKAASLHRGATKPEVICEVDTGRLQGVDVELSVTLESIPMLARAGAIIPMQPVMQYVDEKPLDELTLAIFPGSGRGEWYHDDGRSHAYREGHYLLEHYDLQSAAGGPMRLTLVQRSGSDTFAPAAHLLRFEAVAKSPARVTLGGQPLRRAASVAAAQKGKQPTWAFDARGKRLWVRVPRWAVGAAIELHARR